MLGKNRFFCCEFCFPRKSYVRKIAKKCFVVIRAPVKKGKWSALCLRNPYSIRGKIHHDKYHNILVPLVISERSLTKNRCLLENAFKFVLIKEWKQLNAFILLLQQRLFFPSWAREGYGPRIMIARWHATFMQERTSKKADKSMLCVKWRGKKEILALRTCPTFMHVSNSFLYIANS